MAEWWQGILAVVLAAILVTLLTKSFPYIAKTMTNLTIAQEIERKLNPLHGKINTLQKELNEVKKELSDLKDLLTGFLMERYREDR